MRFPNFDRLGPWFWVGLSVALCGCGDVGPARYRVSGTVTIAGWPVPDGMIFFEPDAEHGNRGPTGFATIVQGRFDTAGSPPGRPAIAGPHRVRIEANAHAGYAGADAAQGRASVAEQPPSGITLPRQFLTVVTLPSAASSQAFEIPKRIPAGG